ncbi:outer membrane protein [Helicobacter acinonychis]|uniref:Outer membrane protein 1 3 n=2 Tax=Helicobacter acinonychis TaxID=212 RepID=Q17ZM6_HELAH|nr:outer membrane protein 1 fragment 3 [Helicobacter acinonychis str. Sheeba]SFZ70472.1 OMP248 [Helicobacter acinonychis]SFZ70779.1 OMP139 [Helicobacter acinonychis]STP04977.1 outer membrane protein [Helicobacter acinonychis]
MIANANKVVNQTKALNSTQESQIQNLGQFNPFNTNETAFADKMLQKRLISQSALLNLATQVANNFKSINSLQQHYMQTCLGGVGGVGHNARYSSCAKLASTLGTLENTVAYYGDQINWAETIANTLLNFSNSVDPLQNTYNFNQNAYNQMQVLHNN